MKKPVKTLFPLNGLLNIAGVIYYENKVAMDLEDGIIFLQHPTLGELAVTCDHRLNVRFLDLEAPALMRALRADQGWVTMTLDQLFDLVRSSLEGRIDD